MELQRGKLLDHVHLQVADLGVSKRFYQAVLSVLGRAITAEGPDFFAAGELFFTQTSGTPSHAHLAFRAQDQAAVRRFHTAAIAAGARDLGAPGEHPDQPGDYAAFAIDPDGNRVEAVWHGQRERPAQSVATSAG